MRRSKSGHLRHHGCFTKFTMKHSMKFNSEVWNWRMATLLGVAMIVGAPATRVQAVSTVITETIDYGDDLQNHTVISPVLEMGTNIIHGSVDGHTFGTDHDYFRVTLPAGSRLEGLSVRVSNYSTSFASAGLFDVLPAESGNMGSINIAGNSTQVVPFLIGAPTNIIMHAVTPFAVEMGATTSYDYEVELVVEPIELVAGTAIHTAVEITFPAEAGAYYQLQCTSDLNSDAWINVGNPMPGEDGTMSAFDTTRRANQRFYRVVKQ